MLACATAHSGRLLSSLRPIFSRELEAIEKSQEGDFLSVPFGSATLPAKKPVLLNEWLLLDMNKREILECALSCVPFVTSIQLSSDTQVDDEALAVLSKFPHLSKLQLLSNCKFTETGLANLLRNLSPSLHVLELESVIFGDECIAAISQMQNLQRLSLRSLQLTNEQFRAIISEQVASSLLHVVVDSCGQVDSFSPLQLCKKLEYLEVASQNFTEQNMVDCFDMLPNLDHLSLSIDAVGKLDHPRWKKLKTLKLIGYHLPLTCNDLLNIFFSACRYLMKS